MSLESIEKLWDHLSSYDYKPEAKLCLGIVLDYLNKINQEIAVRYIELPMDADGVPIRVGDVMECSTPEGTKRRVVKAVGPYCFAGYEIYPVAGNPLDMFTTMGHRHQPPDTWERIIEDAMKLGYTDPDNEQLERKLVARCKALSREDE